MFTTDVRFLACFQSFYIYWERTGFVFVCVLGDLLPRYQLYVICFHTTFSLELDSISNQSFTTASNERDETDQNGKERPLWHRMQTERWDEAEQRFE
jgi:hypothetical protein